MRAEDIVEAVLLTPLLLIIGLGVVAFAWLAIKFLHEKIVPRR